MSVVGEAKNGREAIELARELKPDVMVLDISMPELNGIEAARRVKQEVPGVRIIALSMHSDRRFVTEMLKASASAFLLKDCAFEELVIAIHTVASGQVYLSPRIADVVVEDYVNQIGHDRPSAFAGLTPREREVLQLIAEGKSTKQAAAALHVSVKTIETHRRQIMEKLDTHSIAELTKYGVREGLTTLEE